MKIHSHAFAASTATRLLFIAATIATGTLRAQSVGEEPVGFTTVTLRGKSDTVLAIPLARAAEFAGSGRLSDTKSGSAATIAISGAPFQAGQFAAGRHYVRLESGARAGAFYTITGNTANALTIDLHGDTPPSARVDLRIVPYWTLGTLFPGKLPRTTVLIPDADTTGLDYARAARYNYRVAGKKWVQAGRTASANDTILYPDTLLVVRNKGAAKTLTVAGAVVTGKLAIPLAVQREEATYNYTALARPTAATLAASGLSRNQAVRGGDRVLVFDNTVSRLNKKPSAIYRYANGAWKRIGASGNAGSDLLPANAGVIVKKAAAKAATVWWSNPSPYSF